MSNLESKVITYHQSKLIIADWVGVVNDYRRVRAEAVSHIASSQCGPGKWGGELGGGPVYSVSTGKLPPLEAAKKSDTEKGNEA